MYVDYMYRTFKNLLWYIHLFWGCERGVRLHPNCCTLYLSRWRFLRETENRSVGKRSLKARRLR